MAADFGTQVVTSAGTAEPLTNDLDANAKVKAASVVRDILFKSPSSNSGDVYVGRIEEDNETSHVSSTYGFTLGVGESVTMSDVNDKFEHFEVDAANSGDAVEWAVVFV